MGHFQMLFLPKNPVNVLYLSIYLSTEKDIDTRLMKAWTPIDKLSIIWKSDLTDKMKRRGRIDTAIWMHYLDANKTAGEKARRAILNKYWRQHPT